MAIKDSDIKILWGRSAGICSKPDCREDLTAILAGNKSYVVGEMAHIIAHSEGGPRGRKGGGSDSYENLILLCPTCHTHIDKAPAGEFTEDLLLEWKVQHEDEIRKKATQHHHATFDELRAAISPMMNQNHFISTRYGPLSEIAQKDPTSNAVETWHIKKETTIIPNNRAIVEIVSANLGIIPTEAKQAFFEFRDHAEGFEQNHLARLDHYPLFPQSFAKEFLHD